MDDISILKLRHEGYCCSQIMVKLFLDAADRENNDLVTFSGGLCMGAGHKAGTCGILTAGMGVLALYTGMADERLSQMQAGFLNAFKAMAPNGTACGEITGASYPSPDPKICAPLLGAALKQLLAILTENGIDPAEIPDE